MSGEWEAPYRITVHMDREDVMECWSVGTDEPVEDVGVFDVEYVRADLHAKLEQENERLLDALWTIRERVYGPRRTAVESNTLDVIEKVALAALEGGEG